MYLPRSQENGSQVPAWIYTLPEEWCWVLRVELYWERAPGSAIQGAHHQDEQRWKDKKGSAEEVGWTPPVHGGGW